MIYFDRETRQSLSSKFFDALKPGGYLILDDSGYFNIGKRNLAALRKIFWGNGVMVDNEHVEGTVARTVRRKIDNGETTISIGKGKEIIL